MPRCPSSNGRATQIQQGHGHTENTTMCMKISTVRTLEYQSYSKVSQFVYLNENIGLTVRQPLLLQVLPQLWGELTFRFLRHVNGSLHVVDVILEGGTTRLLIQLDGVRSTEWETNEHRRPSVVKVDRRLQQLHEFYKNTNTGKDTS